MYYGLCWRFCVCVCVCVEGLCACVCVLDALLCTKLWVFFCQTYDDLSSSDLLCGGGLMRRWASEIIMIAFDNRLHRLATVACRIPIFYTVLNHVWRLLFCKFWIWFWSNWVVWFVVDDRRSWWEYIYIYIRVYGIFGYYRNSKFVANFTSIMS